jgi:hypothetical protein
MKRRATVYESIWVYLKLTQRLVVGEDSNYGLAWVVFSTIRNRKQQFEMHPTFCYNAYSN